MSYSDYAYGGQGGGGFDVHWRHLHPSFAINAFPPDSQALGTNPSMDHLPAAPLSAVSRREALPRVSLSML